jgi:hypothetical protein
MDYIRVTKENIDKEHICCAMSGKQSLAKKEWLKQRFEDGLVFTAVQSAASALSSTSRQKTHGCPLMRQAGFISTVCGSPAP